MEREAAADKRVPHFYLLDAILAVRAAQLGATALEAGGMVETACACNWAGSLPKCRSVGRPAAPALRQLHLASSHLDVTPRLTRPPSLPNCQQMARKNVEGRGPGSIVGNIFPRVVGAALSQLVFLMGRSLESAQKVGQG